MNLISDDPFYEHGLRAGAAHLQALEVLVIEAFQEGGHVAPHFGLHAGLGLLCDLVVALVVLVQDDVRVRLEQLQHLIRRACQPGQSFY